MRPSPGPAPCRAPRRVRPVRRASARARPRRRGWGRSGARAPATLHLDVPGSADCVPGRVTETPQLPTGTGSRVNVLRRATATLLLAAVVAVIGAIALLDGEGDGGSSADATVARAQVRSDPVAREAARRQPLVVMLVLDEFPTDVLRRPDGGIDAARYPNFAKLAATSTWFPNHTTVFDETSWAIPAILDGRRPRPGSRPLLGDHPRNLFTLLAARGWGVTGEEVATALCPSAAVRRARDREARAALPPGRAAVPAAAVGALDQAPLAALALPQARVPAAQAVGVPAIGQERPADPPRAAAGHQQHAQLRRSLPGAAQRAPPAAAGGLPRPPARLPAAPPAAHRAAGPQPDRGDRRSRLRMGARA